MIRSRPIHQHSFRAMGCTIDLVLVGRGMASAEAALVTAATLAEEWEQTFSRFRPESELSRVNAGAGQPVAVSDLLFGGVEAALQARRDTGGLFDPAVLPALLAVGYDRSFERIDESGGGEPPVLHPAGREYETPIDIDRVARSVCLPAGAALDLGGIAKGMYADELARRLASWPGGAVSAGGDLRVWGVPPDGDQWIVGVEAPDGAGPDVATIALRAGGVATSGTNRRAWRRGDVRVHHLIDPRTGQPAASGILTATVVAPTAHAAEVAATALLVGGCGPDALDRMRRLFTRAVIVTDAGEVLPLLGTMEIESNATRPRAA